MDRPANRPIDQSTDYNDAIERKERCCSFRFVLISLMDRVRTNATLFAEHSARIKRTLRRALDTRIVLRSTMTPISPTSSSRRFSPFYLFLLRFIIGDFFFHSMYAPFFNVLVVLASAEISFFMQICLRIFRRCLSSILILFFCPTLNYFKHSVIYGTL